VAEDRPTINMFADDDAPAVSAKNGRAPRRKRSLVRSLALVVFAGLLGSAAGYYALLWMRGPNIDFLNVAQYLPAAALPASFQTQSQVARTSPPVATPNTTPETGTQADPAVANATEPTEPQELAPTTDDAAEPIAPETATADIDAAPTEADQQSAEMQAGYTEQDPPGEAVAPASAVGDRYATSAEEAPNSDAANAESTSTDRTAEKPAVADLSVNDLEETNPSTDSSTTSDLNAAELAAGETTATEPATLETPPADPLFGETETAEPAPATDQVQISGTPTFTANEVSTSLTAAKNAQPQLVAGNFADGKEVKRAKGMAFAVLADLAQKATFAHDSSGAAPASQNEVEELFRTTLADPQTRGEVAQIVPMWMSSANRKHGGIFFAGTVTGQQQAGSVVECQVELDGGRKLTVLAPASGASAVDNTKPVAVVGWILDKPESQVGGYTGATTEAIWASKLLPLE
jgi:hypothetical protein